MALLSVMVTVCCQGCLFWSVAIHHITTLFDFQREARRHFGCPTLNGMELENLGPPGTQYGHWKKKLIEVCITYTVDM